MIWNRSLIVIALALAAIGCGSSIRTSIAHPARVGRVMPNALVRADRNGEGTGFGARLLAGSANTSTRRLPPGTLDDAVRLVRFDQAGVCFDLLSRHTEPSSIDFRNGIEAQLIAQPGDGAVVSSPTIVASPPRGHTALAETEVSVRDGWTSGCDDDGCWSQPAYSVETQNVAASVYESRALFCFPNAGAFAPTTQAIELILPHGHFRWEFDAPANGWARPVITMEPIYEAPTNALLRMAPPMASLAPRS